MALLYLHLVTPNTAGAGETPGPSLVATALPPACLSRCHAVLPVVKDEATRHGAQEQDDGQVELELLILILVGKPAAADTPRRGCVAITILIARELYPIWGVGPSPHLILDLLPPTSHKDLPVPLRKGAGIE